MHIRASLLALSLVLAPTLCLAQSYQSSTYPPDYSKSPGMHAGSMTPQGGMRVQPMVNGNDVGTSNPLPVTGTFAGGSFTPTTPSNTAIVTGGTAVTVFPADSTTANSRICDPSGSSVNMFVNSVTTATTTASGSNELIVPGQCWYAGGILTTAVSANAASPLTFTAVE